MTTTETVADVRKPAGVIETHHTDSPTEWGYSFTDHNPEPDDYIRCASEADAWKLDRHIRCIESAIAAGAEPVAVVRLDPRPADIPASIWIDREVEWIKPLADLPIGTKLFAGPSPVADAEALADFTEWLAREMPGGTVISDPRWWAPRIARRLAGSQS